jgi:hypothetical protein
MINVRAVLGAMGTSSASILARNIQPFIQPAKTTKQVTITNAAKKTVLRADIIAGIILVLFITNLSCLQQYRRRID